jgi:outer membrane protein, heavy metal efflux system
MTGMLAALVPMTVISLIASLALAAASPASAPLPLPEDPVVAAIVEEALENSPDVGRADAVARAQLDRAPQVGSLPDPMLNLGIQNDGFDGIQIGKMETSYWQVMATQPIPWPGKLGAREAAARAQASVADAEAARLRMTIAADVERAYVDLLLVRGQLELLGKLESLWKEAEVMARTRYEVGQGSQSDLLRAQLERTRLRQRRVALEGEERTRVQVLNRLRVHPLDEPVATPRSLAALSDPRLLPPGEAVADAERRSPDLAIAARAVMTADRRVESARKDWFPDFAVTAGIMPRGQLVPMWTVQLGITIPVFGATKQGKAVEESQARREADLRGEESVRQVVQLRAQERRTLLAAALETLAIYRDGILIQSDATVRSTFSQYQVGKSTFSSVLEVLRGFVIDEGGYLDAQATAQRVGIADREVSLAPSGGPAGSRSGASMPGAGAMTGGGRPAGSTDGPGGTSGPAPADGGGGMPTGM